MKSIFIIMVVFIYNAFVPAAIIDNDTTSTQLKKIRLAIEQKNAKWTASETSISKLSLEEKKQLFGMNREYFKDNIRQKVDIPIIQDLPASFSWRDNNGDWLTPVKNQQVQQCGSCWDFGAVAQVESWWKIKNENPDSMINLSEQYLISCSAAGDCGGGWTNAALAWISQYGIPPEDCLPYMASDTVSCESCCENWEENAVKIPGWGWVTLEYADIMSIKSAVYHQPVLSLFFVYEDYTYYSGGLYEHVTGFFVAGHVVVIYGWDDAEQSWLCKDAQGEGWGENGYCRIKWGECGIGEGVVRIWNDITEQSPFKVVPSKITAKIEAGTSLDTTITITNMNSNILEFTTFDFANEPTFHPSDYNSYDGSSIWCGDEKLNGYGNFWIKYLDTPVLNLSTTSEPEISCLMKWSTDGDPYMNYDGGDGGNIMISDDGGKSFELLKVETPEYNCDSLISFDTHGLPFGTGGWSGMTNWQHVQADLSNYRSDEVVIRFTFLTSDYNCTANNLAWKGLFIDSLLVKDNVTIIYENQGENIDDMRRSGIGGSACSWIEISENPGIVTGGDSIQLQININTENLRTAGTYNGSVVLATNNRYYEYYEIPVVLDVVTSISSSPDMIPHIFALFQNYPNPFNPSTTIEFTLPKSEFVELKVYNILGKKVSTLVSNKLNQGNYTFTFDGKNLASGIYYYQLVAGDQKEVKKMILMK